MGTEVHQDSYCFSQNQEQKISLESRGITQGLPQVISRESKDALPTPLVKQFVPQFPH